MIELFGNRSADGLTPQEIEQGLADAPRERAWSAASFNRHKAFTSLAYRLGIERGKVSTNPARLVRRRHEDSGRIRWLTAEEESRLRAIIASDYCDQLPAFDLALHTGMRRSEQYRLTWDCVDFERRQLTILRSKHGGTRYIALDDTAIRALQALRQRVSTSGRVMVLSKGSHGYCQGHALKSPREWFASACQLANITDLRWHDLRHYVPCLTMSCNHPLAQYFRPMYEAGDDIVLAHSNSPVPWGQARRERGFDSKRVLARDSEDAPAGISGRLQDPCASRDTPRTRFTRRFYAPCGQERVGTPQIHLEAMIAMKETVWAKTSLPQGRRSRNKPAD